MEVLGGGYDILKSALVRDTTIRDETLSEEAGVRM